MKQFYSSISHVKGASETPMKLFSTLLQQKKLVLHATVILGTCFFPLTNHMNAHDVSTLASQEQKANQAPDRIKLGEKKAHPKNKKQKKSSRIQKLAASQVVSKGCGTLQSQYLPTYSIKAVGVSGKTLTMNDETIWEIAPRFAYIAENWPKNSKIVIRPNRGWGTWFSNYDYRLFNLTTGNEVEADLSQGPFVKHAIFITEINRYNGYIRLSDGSIWAIDGQESFAKLQKWKEKQAVLFGENNNWFGFPYILININENEYLPVQFSRLY